MFTSGTCDSQRVMDCSAFKGQHKKSGVYTIFPQKSKPDKIQVYCDMKTDGGGWTVRLLSYIFCCTESCF